MKINCLSCGHKVDLDDAYDDYKGLVKCFVCGALLEISAEEGGLKSLQLLNIPRYPTPEEAVEHTS